ncbi:hypothetical protein ACIQGZ_14570 [Streptomyces sp. NPDC092296]|uniref:hypothetical protein n=1 Tax=Streptomyces sp. NPDC092296 TaxID=3366012 RepID=UPI0038065468
MHAELAAIPINGPDNRTRRKVLSAALAELPPFRRMTGAATRGRVRARLGTALNAAIPRGLITFKPAARVELDPATRPKALDWTPKRVAQWREASVTAAPALVWTPRQTGARPPTSWPTTAWTRCGI